MTEVPRVGVAVIILDGRRVLLGKRKGAHGAGTWGFPGGHLEHGEDLHDCALREVMEETGMRLLQTTEGPYTNTVFTGVDTGKHYITLYILAKAVEGDTPEIREPDKCDEWRWFDWDDLPPHDRLFLPIKHLVRTGYRPVFQ